MNINQFNLFKTNKQCKNANLTEDDYNKNQEFLEELEKAEELYECEVALIKSKYTYNQRVLTTAYNMYISRYLEYKLFFAMSLGLISPVAIALLCLNDYSGLDVNPIILFSVTSILSFSIGIHSYLKIRKFNKLK